MGLEPVTKFVVVGDLHAVAREVDEYRVAGARDGRQSLRN